MNADQVLKLIERDAVHFYLSPADALPAFVEILSESAASWSPEDFATLVAVGSLLYREAEAEGISQRVLANLRTTVRR